MGDISSVLVPRHSFVRIPRYEERKTNDQCFKYQTCVCGQHNRLNNCKPIICTRRESCFLGQNPVVKGNKMENTKYYNFGRVLKKHRKRQK